MRLPVLLSSVIALLLGVAAGGYFAHGTGHPKQFSGSGQGTSSGSSSSSIGSEKLGVGPVHAPEEGSPGTKTFNAEDLSALLDDSNSYSAIKGLLAYMDNLRPEDFPKVLDQLRSASESNRDEALDILIGKWMEVDPQGALDALTEARKLETPELAAKVVSGVYGAWADSDPAGALAAARQSLTGEERKTALKAIVDKVARNDPAQALALVKGMDKNLVTDYLPSIFSHWAGKDPAEATQALLQLTDEKQRGKAIEGMADQLVQNDPRSALAWMDQLPFGKTRDAAQGAVADQWAQIDPRSAIKWAESLPPTARDAAVNTIANEWISHDGTSNDAAGMIDYAGTIPDGPEKDRLMGGMAVAQWAYDDAQAAWDWAQKLPGQKKNDALVAIGSSWSDYDPETATTYALSLPHGQTREATLRAIAGNWDYANTDPDKTTAWMAQLPAGGPHDDAIGKFSDQVSNTDPEQALQWAATIGDAKARQTQVTNLYQKWMQADPANASVAVQNSDLPADVKSRLVPTKH